MIEVLQDYETWQIVAGVVVGGLILYALKIVNIFLGELFFR